MTRAYVPAWLRAIWPGKDTPATHAMPMPADDATTPAAPPVVTWAASDAPAVDGLSCPNCGNVAPKPLVLTVVHTPPRRAAQSWRVVGCPGCTCCFYERQDIPDYGDDEMLTRGRAALYLQQGAGLAQLFRPVSRFDFPPGSRYLDIGCGFGFGLDFARRSKGWEGLGIDPAQIAALGRSMLGLPIEQRLLGDDEPTLRAACDVVMAAETIEHVPSPAGFLAILKRVLAPAGVLVLTTPDAAAIQPETPPGQLAGLLSPELHLVLQSEASLRRLLHAAGFAHVEVERDGGALVAYASAEPLALEADPSAFRLAYRTYLEDRAGDFGAADDLFWGFAGRALLESVNDGDLPRASRLQATLARACINRFGIDLADPILPEGTHGATLARLVELMPLNLAAILYACAMLALAQGGERLAQEQRLSCAAEAAHRLRRAVGALAMEDALSEDLGWAASAEALLCAVANPQAQDVVTRLRALPPAPGVGGGARRDQVVARAFVALVNAGQYAEASALAQAVPLLMQSPPGPEVDAIFCRAVLALQTEGDAVAARADFAWVRQSVDTMGQGAVPGLFWAALRGEILACDKVGQEDKGADLRRAVVTEMRARGATIPADYPEFNEYE